MRNSSRIIGVSGNSVMPSTIKRVFDFMFALLGLIILSPVLLVLSIMIKLSSRGAVFYSQYRVGRHGELFKLVKFRTMMKDAEKMDGGSITVAGDKRVTPVGGILRRWKLDELATLWNVLKGDMSFVGPRPDVPGYADQLEGEARKILSFRPGITGTSTLKYRNEEQLLASVSDPEKYNDEVIFPDKIRINLDYIDNWSFWGDIYIIFKTLLPKES